MKYTIQVIPQEYTVEAECADHAMIAVASATGNNNIRMKTKASSWGDVEMKLRNLVDMDEEKHAYIQTMLKNDQEKLAESVNTVKRKPQRKFSN